MQVFFKPTFIKDFKQLPPNIQREVRYICIEIFPKLKDIKYFQEHSIRRIKGFKGYYRIRLGDYRIGFKKTKASAIEFMRVKNRKEIYRHFP